MRDRFALQPPSHHERRYWIAALVCERFRSMRREEGTQAAARRLRKSGIARDPIIALRILGITPSHVPASTSQRLSLPTSQPG